PDGSLLWVDADGRLRRDGDCADPAFGEIVRIVPGRRVTWVLDDGGLHRLDAATLQRLGVGDLADVRDIAPAAADGLWALTDAGAWHVDARGRIVAGPSAVPHADGIAASGATIALLDRAAERLALTVDGRPPLTVDLAAILGPGGPTFTAQSLVSAPDGFCLDGAWDGADGYLFLDLAGEPGRWGVWIDTAPVAIAPSGDSLIALFDTGTTWSIRRFAGAAAAGGRLWLTPALESDTLAGKWLRADLRAILPDLATLDLRWATSKDPALRTVATEIADDESRLRGDRIRSIEMLLDWSPWRSFVGAPGDGEPEVDASWLPDLAALLGLPFDATLPEQAQRAIVTAAPDILAGRGTRRGLLALLEAALPGRHCEVIDRSDEFAAVTLGGDGSGGSRLP